MIYGEVFKMLEQRKIRYVVAGGVAVVLHGVPRATMDLDLIVHLDRENMSKFIQGMTQLGFLPKVPVNPEELADPQKRQTWMREKEIMSLVDVFIQEPIAFAELENEKVIVTIEKVPISIVSKRHLKQLKKVAGREQDLADVQTLQELDEIEK